MNEQLLMIFDVSVYTSRRPVAKRRDCGREELCEWLGIIFAIDCLQNKFRFFASYYNLAKGGVCWFQRVPTECGADLLAYQTALWLVESCLQIVVVVSDVAVSQWNAWASGLHSGNGRYTVRLGHMADLQRARWILRIDCGPVGSCGSPFYRCLLADLLQIDCGLGRRSIWRIYCMPVVFCGSTGGQLDLAEPLFHKRLFVDLLRIDGGPVDRSGWFTVGLWGSAKMCKDVKTVGFWGSAKKTPEALRCLWPT